MRSALPLNIMKLPGISKSTISKSTNVLDDKIKIIWLQSNKPYDADYITKHGSCQILNVRIHIVELFGSQADLCVDLPVGLLIHPAQHHAHSPDHLDGRHVYHVALRAYHHEEAGQAACCGRIQGSPRACTRNAETIGC